MNEWKYEYMKTTDDFPLLCPHVWTVCVWAPLSEGVEPQSLHRPTVRHPLRPSTLCVFFQLAAGGSPWGQSCTAILYLSETASST